jgi:hypothetical protein
MFYLKNSSIYGSDPVFGSGIGIFPRSDPE